MSVKSTFIHACNQVTYINPLEPYSGNYSTAANNAIDVYESTILKMALTL